MTHISKRSRKTYSSRMAPAHSQKKFAWNGQAVFAPRLAALSSAPCVLFSIAVWASMARRRLIALCVMNWRICSRNLAQVDVGSRRTGRNGSGPAPILELPGKRAVTISPSRFDVRRVGIFTRARIAGAVLHGRGDCAAHPPVLRVAAHSIGAATISDSSSNSFGARQRISLLRLSMFDRVQKGSVGRGILGSARASRAPFGASPNGRKFDGGIVVLLRAQRCSRRGAANSTRGRVRSPDLRLRATVSDAR